ncbi:MAG: hypothetical protein WBO23_12295 [Burkholderiales bacterium]
MCYEFDRLYWLQRAAEVRREMEKAEKAKKEEKPVPAKSATGDSESGTQVPVPA